MDLSIAHSLVVFSSFLMIWGGYAYFRDTLSGKTKPNRVSWFMWALAPLVSIGAALTAEADLWASTRVIVGGIVPLLIFLASFINRNSYWRITVFDSACGIISLLALFFWLFTSSPLVAILLATTANTFATVPTFIKAWKYPETETRLTYITSFLSAVLIVPSIPDWSIENSAFQIGLIFTTALLVFAIYRNHVGVGWRKLFGSY